MLFLETQPDKYHDSNMTLFSLLLNFLTFSALLVQSQKVHLSLFQYQNDTLAQLPLQKFTSQKLAQKNEKIEQTYKKFDQLAYDHLAVVGEFESFILNCDIAPAIFPKNQILIVDFNVFTRFASNDFKVQNVEKLANFTIVDQKAKLLWRKKGIDLPKLINLTSPQILIKNYKFYKAGIFYCSCSPKSVSATALPHEAPKLDSNKILIGYKPKEIMSVSFCLTAIATIIITFIINWFDLGKYYCNFLDRRLEKAKELNESINFTTPMSVRASKASLHYSKYDSKSQNLFLSSLVNSASNVKSAIAEKVENFELSIPLRDALKGHFTQNSKPAGSSSPGTQHSLNFLEFSIPLPNFFERRRESAIREETEAELARDRDADADQEVDAIFSGGHKTDPENSPNLASSNPGFKKKIKQNLGKTMKSLNIRLKTSDLVSQDFLENFTLKLKFHQFQNRGGFFGQENTLIGQPDAAFRLANSEFDTNSTQNQFYSGMKPRVKLPRPSLGSHRPKTLNLNGSNNTLPIHHKASNSDGIFTIDVIDDRKSLISEEGVISATINSRILPSSSVVVTPIDADSMENVLAANRQAPAAATCVTNLQNSNSKSMTPTFFLTLDSAIFENIAIHDQRERRLSSHTRSNTPSIINESQQNLPFMSEDDEEAVDLSKFETAV